MTAEALQTEDKVSFEEGISQLERIVRGLEQKEVPLEEALTLFRQGIGLVQHCNRLLDHAEREMQILLEDSQGELLIHPAEYPMEG